MPTYEHKCETCQHEWEEDYSIKADPPTVCPNCQANTVKRLISLGGKGVVELTGQELKDSVKASANIIKQNAARNENTYANLLGPDRYQGLQQRIDKANSEKRR